MAGAVGGWGEGVRKTGAGGLLRLGDEDDRKSEGGQGSSRGSLLGHRELREAAGSYLCLGEPVIE